MGNLNPRVLINCVLIKNKKCICLFNCSIFFSFVPWSLLWEFLPKLPNGTLTLWESFVLTGLHFREVTSFVTSGDITCDVMSLTLPCLVTWRGRHRTNTFTGHVTSRSFYSLMDGWTDGQTDGWVDSRRTDRWTDGWINGPTDERTDGQTDGQTD